MSGAVLITGGAGFIGSHRAEELPQAYWGDGLIEPADRCRGQVAIERGDRGPWSSKGEG